MFSRIDQPSIVITVAAAREGTTGSAFFFVIAAAATTFAEGALYRIQRGEKVKNMKLTLEKAEEHAHTHTAQLKQPCV